MAEVSKLDITSYVDFLPNQYSDSPNLQKLLSIFLTQVQELEDANIDLDNVSTDITVAYGYQLDILGKLVGASRRGRTDEQYREAIYFQISLNVGQGTPEDVIQYLAYVTQATNVNYWEHYPASVVLETNGSVVPSNIPTTLDNITPAGVSVGGVIASESGMIFRGCDSTVAYSNYIDIPAGEPYREVGGYITECGDGDTECLNDGYQGFQPVNDTDPLARCIFPDINSLYQNTTNGAGEELMAAGESMAEAGDPYDEVLTYKGVFGDIFTDIQ